MKNLPKQRQKKNIIVKMFFFIIILLGLWIIFKTILKKPVNGDWENNNFSMVYDKNKDFDVILSGTSIVLANISNQELYSKYGIGAVSLGEPEQPIYLSYYMLKEALKYQDPKVVILDVQSLFYSREKIQNNLKEKEYYYLHYSLDKMKNGITKYEALQAAKELKNDINFWDYFSGMYYSHANWEELNKDNFTLVESDVKNGDMFLTDIYQYTGKYSDTILDENDNSGNMEEIWSVNREYFNKIVELCRINDTELLLVRSSFSGESIWSWGQYNTVEKLAQDNQLTYLDINMLIDKVGFDKKMDMGDGVHFNVEGSRKWTDYIGKYISEKYDINNRKYDKNYDYYQNGEEILNNKLEYVREKKELLQCVTLDGYLEKIMKYKKDGYVIGVAVSDDASNQITENECQLLRKLGLQISLLDQYRSSYVGLIEDGNVIEEALAQNGIEKEGNFNNLDSYKISSGGYDSNINASIKINGIEFCQGKRGINIVVYDKKNKEAISSVFFDTYLSENPHPSIVKADKIYEMIDVNEWKAIVADY